MISADVREQAHFDMVSAVGNNELKGLVFGVLANGNYTSTTLHRETMDLQGSNPSWPIAVQTPFSYCRIFHSAGVAEKASESPLTYRISERGRRLALPMVGHLLDVSLQEEQPLMAFHGPTHAKGETGVRPSQYRIGMMQEMRRLDGKTTSMAEIATKLGILISQAGSVAEDLATYGIVNRESNGRGKAAVSFTPTARLWDLELRSDVGSKLLFDVTDILRSYFRTTDSPIDNRQIATILIRDHGYEDDVTLLTKLVSRRTNMLAFQREALQSNRSLPGHNTRETISATDQQLRTIENVLQATEGARKPTKTYLLDGHDKLQLIIGDEEMVNFLSAKARVHSIGLKRLPEGREENIAAVNEVLRQSDRPMTAREIQDVLHDQGIVLDKAVIRQYLTRTVESGGAAATTSPAGTLFARL